MSARCMGFIEWVAHHVKTTGAAGVGVIVGFVGIYLIAQDQAVVGAGLLIVAAALMLWTRYQTREHQIKTQQRKYGRR